MYDILIKGGDVIDGTGSAGRRADVGIQGDRIVAIGELDAGAVVTIRRHRQGGRTRVRRRAHALRRAGLLGRCAHAVAVARRHDRVLAGNCGFTIAPLSDDPADGDYLMRMLARVEGMPLESLRSGVPWNWKSTAEYFGEIEGRLGINVGFMVGHSAISAVS